jgi:hypothetical protein
MRGICCCRAGLLFALSFVAALFMNCEARATVIYSNLGSGNSYNTNLGWTIGQSLTQGDSFTVSGTGTFKLTSLELAVGNVSGSSAFTVQLETDVGGAPGSVLESWIATANGTFGNNNPLVVVNSVSNTTLQAGQTYWIVLSAGSNDINPWNFNNTGATGTHYNSASGTSNNTQGAFRVNADPAVVPEPSSLAICGVIAVAGLCCRCRNRRRSMPVG